MTRDLGTEPGQVHDCAAAVLDFWFALPVERQFAKDAALDQAIAGRFGALRQAIVASAAAGWRDDPDALLAAVIVLDQFSRNIHRDQAAAFAADPLARELALTAIARGWDKDCPVPRRAFLYMPLMHAEDAALQALSVAEFEAMGDAHHLRYAHEHRDVIARFGRFPSRNAALGRRSTAEEQRYLSQPGAGW